MKIVIVDDEASIISLVKHLIPFEKLGLSLIGEAVNGEQALDLCSRLEPDIIVSDIRMPGMDGLTFIKKIKSILPFSIIIIISGFNDFDYAREAIKSGVFDYILKPIDEDELVQILRKAISEIKKNRLNKKNKRELKTQIKKLQNEFISSDNSHEKKQSVDNLMIMKAVSYIAENYNRDISLETVADKVYINPHYFSELFKKNLGTGFSEYITRMRIEKAKELLLIPEFKVKEISEMIGYRDSSYFIRVFKKSTGESPSVYRRVNLGK